MKDIAFSLAARVVRRCLIWLVACSVLTPMASKADETRYQKWRYSPAIFTWEGTTTTFTSGKYAQFDAETGEPTGLVLTGNVSSKDIPGYEGTATTPNYIFQSGNGRRYKAPGYTLRFVAGYSQPINFAVPAFHLGGIIVEPGAVGCGFSTPSGSRTTFFGDTNVVDGVDTWFEFNEDFTVNRGADVQASALIRHYGKVNFDIAEGKVVDLNSGKVNASNVLDVATSAWLKLHGKGTLKANFFAKGGEDGVVTLDYSDVDPNRETPYIDGYIEIDANTRFAFPAGFDTGSTFELCKKINGPAAGEFTVFIGGVEQRIQLKISGGSVTYVGSPRAVIDRDINWSELTWSPALEPGLPVELVFNNAATLTFDQEGVELPLIKFAGSGAATFAMPYVPMVDEMRIPDGFDLTFLGGDSQGDTKVWAGHLVVGGRFKTSGFVTLTDSSNEILSTGSMTISDGEASLNSATRGMAGVLNINAGAKLTALASEMLSEDSAVVNVRGVLALGGNRWVLRGAESAINLYADGSIEGEGDASGAIDLYSCLHLISEGADASVTVSAPLRYQANSRIDVDGGMTLVIAGASKANGGAASKIGAGTILFETSQMGTTSNFTVREGLLELTDECLVTAGTLIVNADARVHGVGTYPGKLTMDAGAVLIADEAGPLVVEGAFGGGRVLIDCSQLVSSPVTVLSASGATADRFLPLDYMWSVGKDGDSIVLTRQDDLVWSYAPAVFAWSRRDNNNFHHGLYKQLDPVTLAETGLVITGDVASVNVPGYVGTNISTPWDIWSMTAGKRYKAPGYVLVFTSDSADVIDASFSDLSFGGMLVKPGAGGNSFLSLGSNSRQTHFGDTNIVGGVDTWFRFQDNFSINRQSSFTFHGKVNIEIASGKSFAVNTNAQCATQAYKLADGAELKMHGDGSLIGGNTLDATGSVVLDFSDLNLNRTTPFINSKLVVSAETQLRFPAGLEAGKPYTLCSGPLTADGADGRKLITVAGRGSFMATVTYDVATRSVKYQDWTNEAVIEGGADAISWDDIKWTGGWRDGAPAVITLAGDAIINIFGTTHLPVEIEFVGEHGVMLVGDDEFEGVPISYAGGAYEMRVPFYWVGPKDGRWEYDLNWDHKVHPGKYVEACITNSITVSSEAIAKGTVRISDGVVLSLSCAGDFQGVDGGELRKSGDGLVQLGNSREGEAVRSCRMFLSEGSLELAQDAVLNNAWVGLGETAQLLAVSNAEISVVGTLSISNDFDSVVFDGDAGEALLYGSGDFVKEGSGTLTLNGGIGSMLDSEYAWQGNLRIDEGLLVLAGTNLTSDVRGLVSGNGALEIRENVIAQFGSSSDWCAEGLRGNGSAWFTAIPSAPQLLDSLCDADVWTGACGFRDVEFKTGINPSQFGNSASAVEFSGCRGSFTADAEFSPKMGLVRGWAADVPSLTLVDGGAGASIVIDQLYGDGGLELENNGAASGYRVFLPAGSDFVGSLMIAGDGNPNGIVIGADDAETRSACLGVDDGRIVMSKGAMTISEGSVWQANAGIRISEEAELVDCGAIASKVYGSGLVRYSLEALPSTMPEAVAGFSDAANWSGRVEFDGVAFAGTMLSQAVNENSKLMIRNSTGTLPAQTIPGTTILVEDGLTVTDANANAIVKFSRVAGSGSLALRYGAVAAGSAYSLMDVSEFRGSLSVETSNGSVLIGTDRRSANGALEFANDVLINSNLDWSAPQAKFGAKLRVNGSVNDTIMKITGSSIESVDSVEVSLTSVEDPRRKFGLKYDNETKDVYIVASPTSPTATLSDVVVTYGADYKTAAVSVVIDGYYPGYDYSGVVVARVYVYDGNGVLRGSNDCIVTENGVISIGSVDVPDGRATDYRYDVTLAIEEGDKVLSRLDGRSISAAGVRRDGPWFLETAETFADPSISTGRWSYDEGAATVDKSNIVIDTVSEDRKPVEFSPHEDDAGEYLQLSAMFTFTLPDSVVGCYAESVDDLLAAVKMEIDGNHGYYNVLVQDPDNADAGKFIRVYGRFDPQLQKSNQITWSLNRKTGRVTYSAGGTALTNEVGCSSFPVPGFAKKGIAVSGVMASGSLKISELKGEKFNANTAGIMAGESLMQYETVDEAVSAAIASGSSEIVLLWDGVWSPTKEEIGSYKFISEDGHVVSIDPEAVRRLNAEGYQVVDKGEGVIAVDVTSYEVSFDANMGRGEMEPVSYSVTNMVFALPQNQFVRDNFDFAFWNEQPDGSGATNWVDGAIIDMRPYGLTNLTVFAQWNLMTREIVVEAADEFVYIESVTTNGIEVADVRYYQKEAASATGSAIIPIRHGENVVIKFSTDIEKELTFNSLERANVVRDEVVVYDALPKIKGSGPTPYTPIQLWALSKGISLDELAASNYSESSYALDVNRLLRQDSVAEIGALVVTESGLALSLVLDGDGLSSQADVAKLARMIQVSESVYGPWQAASADDVSIDEQGRISIKIVGPRRFVKLIIPSNR